MQILMKIPEKVFEVAGAVCGLAAAAFIAVQLVVEISSTRPSTLSLVYVAGFLVNSLFWVFYGLRFRRPAIWIVNIASTFLQTGLLLVVLLK